MVLKDDPQKFFEEKCIDQADFMVRILTHDLVNTKQELNHLTMEISSQ